MNTIINCSKCSLAFPRHTLCKKHHGLDFHTHTQTQQSIYGNVYFCSWFVYLEFCFTIAIEIVPRPIKFISNNLAQIIPHPSLLNIPLLVFFVYNMTNLPTQTIFSHSPYSPDKSVVKFPWSMKTMCILGMMHTWNEAILMSGRLQHAWASHYIEMLGFPSLYNMLLYESVRSTFSIEIERL